MPRNLQVTGPLAPLNFNDAALDNVVHVAVADGGWSMGQIIATVRVSVTASVRGISRYLRIRRGVSSERSKDKSGLPVDTFVLR